VRTGERLGALGLPIDVIRVGAGDLLVLLHGYAASRFTWRSWVTRLASRHALYLVDLKGFGAAPKPTGEGYGPADLAEDVVQLVTRLDLGRVTIVGHSMGGGIALLTALRLAEAGEGDRLEKLVSIAGTAYVQTLPPFVTKLRNPSTQLLLQMLPARWIVRQVLSSIVFDPAVVTDELIDGYAAPLRSWAAKRAAAHCAAELIPNGLDALVARYPSIDVPALLLWGRSDPVVPLWVGERLVRELARARLVVLERCGHVPMHEQPEESLRVVEEFLDEEIANESRRKR
jgi:pimeloyl-ACP methyl ester carboxylesterase